MSKLLSVVYPTENNLYSVNISPIVFSSLPITDLTLSSLKTQTGKEFSQEVYKFLNFEKNNKGKSKNLTTKILSQIDNFYKNATNKFWKILYTKQPIIHKADPTINQQSTKSIMSLSTPSNRKKISSKQKSKTQRRKKNAKNQVIYLTYQSFKIIPF